MRTRLLLLAAGLVLRLAAPLSAQQASVHKLSVEMLGGSSISAINVYEEDGMNIVGFSGAARLMWEPENLLRVGIEGGILHLAHSKEENIQTEFGPTRRTNLLQAYPVMLDFTMKVWKVEVMLGLGAAVISSKINAFSDISVSSVVTSARMYGIGYSMPLTDRLSAGCELTYHSFSTPDLTVATFQLKCTYAVFMW